MFWTCTWTCVHVHVLFMFSRRNIFQNMKFEISEHENYLFIYSTFSPQFLVISRKKRILDEKILVKNRYYVQIYVQKHMFLNVAEQMFQKTMFKNIIWNIMFRTWLNICSEKSCSRTWFWTWIMFMFCSCSWKPRNMGNSDMNIIHKYKIIFIYFNKLWTWWNQFLYNKT